MLSKKSIDKVRDELDNCQNPLIFYDDDPDGLCSFLLLYRYKREGHGVCVKAKPSLNESFLRKVEEYQPDKIFIVDVPVVEEEFVRGVNVPIVWVDHHTPWELPKVKYFNPRVEDKEDGTCLTRICYEVVKQDLWIATLGAIADWQIPDYLEDFRKEFDLIGKKKEIGELYFDSELGTLIKVFSFVLKGKIKDVNKSVRILCRIEDPLEILQQTTSRGKFIFKRYQEVNKEYEELLEEGKKRATDDEFLIYLYSEDKSSFTGDLANELKYRFPDKIVIVGREKSDEVRMSLRSETKRIDTALEKALAGLEGYGGGHEFACGANVKKEDFERFVEVLREEVQ